MFAPLSGVPEDPATGSAGCAVAGLLAHHEKGRSGEFAYRIAQGVEMGRPSVLHARASKSGGVVEATWIGGACVLVSEGSLHVE
jgi:trans-2,3-dihydro-3-hydroxyanthranilate isomerase